MNNNDVKNFDKRMQKARENDIIKSTIKNEKDITRKKGIFKTILIGIILFLIIISYIKVLNGNNTTISFQNFIQMLQTLSNTYITLPTLQNLTITADWGILNVLKDGINTTITIVNVALFVANTMLNLIIGVMNAIRIFFF